MGEKEKLIEQELQRLYISFAGTSGVPLTDSQKQTIKSLFELFGSRHMSSDGTLRDEAEPIEDGADRTAEEWMKELGEDPGNTKA
jgi:hypothetical protein